MSNPFRRFAVVAWIALASACSSTPKNVSALDAPLTDSVRKDLEKYCSRGNPFACYRIGSDFDDRKNWGEAKVWFVKACDLKLAAACSEASVMDKARLNEREDAMKLAGKSCDLNDTLGCYNLGCYQCVYDNNATAAFKSLELAIKLGYRNKESMLADPDLECVRKHKDWAAFLKRFPDEGDSKITHAYALSTGMRHLYHPKLKFSYAAVPGFHIQYSVSGVMVFDDAGSRVYFTGANQPFSEVKALVSKTEMISPGETEIHSDLGKVNGYPAYVRVVKGTAQGLEYIASIYVTGDEKYTVSAQSTYLASYHSTYGQAILQSAESIVLDPRGPPGPAEVPYRNAAKIGSYKYAGLRSGGPIWTPSGILPGRDKAQPYPDTLVVNSFIFSKDEPFDDATFGKIWGMVASQSSIQTAKFDPKKIAKTKSPTGNLSWHYLSPAEQLDPKNAKHPIQLEVGLVKLPHRVPLGELGYFWARVIKSKGAPVTTDTEALSNLQLRPEVLKELQEAPEEEPEVTAPSSVGNGAIPAG
jgi:hypothetical protein